METATMKVLFILAFAMLPGVFGLTEEDCTAPDAVTQLDFFQSDLVTNTLHIPGGELRYQGIGTFHDDAIDLTVTVASGNYTNIATYWAARGKTAAEVNGKRDGGSFGNINLQTKRGISQSGEGTFNFCIVETGTNTPVTLSNFSFTIWDLDWRKNETTTPGVSVKEKLIVDTAQAVKYSVFPNFTESEVSPICEDGSSVNCTDSECTLVHPGHSSCPGTRTVFRASEFGVGPDNPHSPENITDAQRKRAVNFFFENTSCFEITYAHYCPLDDPVNLYDWPLSVDQQMYSHCAMGEYSGGNFLFAGESDALYYEHGCPTASPTMSMFPTDAPSRSPTEEVTSDQGTSDPGTLDPSTNAPSENDGTAQPTTSPYVSSCTAEGGTTNEYGELNLCLRTSLGYTYGPGGGTSTFQEVNFIETLIKITYDMSSGFCVDAFSVAPKEKELTTIEKQYGLIGYMCNPDITTIETDAGSGRSRNIPTEITSYNTPGHTTTFNQGAMIQICVQPDDDTWVDGVVMESVDSFTWKRDPHPVDASLPPLTQQGIVNSLPANNFLTVYIPSDCDGADFCEFSSVLFAQYYYTPGAVTGSGEATMRFESRRRLNDKNPVLLTDEQRRLQEETRPFDMIVQVNGVDDESENLRTAAGASLGLDLVLASSLAGAMALLYAL